MVNEDGYKITVRPYVPTVNTLMVILKRGTVRRPANELRDQVAEGTKNQYIPSGDDLYDWAGFKAMIEGEYGSSLDDAIANHPTDIEAAIAEWLAPYSAAHDSPTLIFNGWEWDGYPPAPDGEPIGGLLPEEPPE
jgi:hypothetical protein